MKVLCPGCGFHHEVVRVLEDGHGESHKDVYQVAPNGECQRTWLTDQDVFEARARFGEDAVIPDEDDA